MTNTLTSEHFKNNIEIKISSEVHTFSNFSFQKGIGFTHKVILDLQEVKCPNN